MGDKLTATEGMLRRDIMEPIMEKRYNRLVELVNDSSRPWLKRVYNLACMSESRCPQCVTGASWCVSCGGSGVHRENLRQTF